MHIANYHGPLTFVEVTICDLFHVTQILKLFSKLAVFTLKCVQPLITALFRVGLHHVLIIFSDF